MPDLKSLPILWAEDSPSDQRLIQVALDTLPDAPPVRFVANGHQLLEHLKEDTPRAVVLDINMPGMTGIEVLERLRSTPATRDVPVILFSNTQNPDEMVKAVKLGAEAFVHKPHEFDAFQQAVHRIARSGRQRQPPAAKDRASPCGVRNCQCQGWVAKDQRAGPQPAAPAN